MRTAIANGSVRLTYSLIHRGEPISTAVRVHASMCGSNVIDHRGRTLLVLNAGSSSLKLALFDAANPDRMITRGMVANVGTPGVELHLQRNGEALHREGMISTDHAGALTLAFEGLRELLGRDWTADVRAVGHRIVHGGSRFTRPTILTSHVEKDLAAIADLAPLHNGRALEVLRASVAAVPGVPQVACFDTMFHSSIPPEAARYALPRSLADRFGIRRYGFHGLSCTWSMERLAALGLADATRVIICHLGAGASVTAVRNGRSIDTTMGFTPLEGLMMATRSGSIDPSIPLFLQRHAGMDVAAVENLLDRESGLLGWSERSGNVEDLEESARSGDGLAEEALAAFAYRVRKAIGAFWAVLGGVDAVVLTGGIGENSRDMRTRILEPLKPLGIMFDETANASLRGGDEGCISVTGNHPRVWVIPAREEQVIAQQVQAAVGA